MKILKVVKKDDMEYILFHASKDTHLYDYAWYDTTYDENGEQSNKWPHFFRFGKNDIMEQDGYVCVHTKKGKPSFKEGPYIKFVEMNLQCPIFNESGDVVHLIKVANNGSASISSP